jgi:hypothetical protein
VRNRIEKMRNVIWLFTDKAGQGSIGVEGSWGSKDAVWRANQPHVPTVQLVDSPKGRKGLSLHVVLIVNHGVADVVANIHRDGGNALYPHRIASPFSTADRIQMIGDSFKLVCRGASNLVRD